MMDGEFYHDRPITESAFFKKATESFLLQDLTNGDYILVKHDEEILPEMPRSPDHQDGTRFIIVNTNTNQAASAFDEERLSTRLDIDKALEFFNKIDVEADVLFGMLVVMIFNLFGTIGEVGKPFIEDPLKIEGIEVDLLAAIVSVCLSDPLDVLFYIWEATDPETLELNKYCQLVAVKPRPKN